MPMHDELSGDPLMTMLGHVAGQIIFGLSQPTEPARRSSEPRNQRHDTRRERITVIRHERSDSRPAPCQGCRNEDDMKVRQRARSDLDGIELHRV